MTKTRIAADAAWMPFIRRSIQDYQKLPPQVRAEILSLLRARPRRFTPPSPEAMFWYGCLPGLPQHNRIVFSAIKKGDQCH